MFLLIGFAANMELKNRKGESASQDAVNVQAVTIPSPPPEIPSPPPSAFTPPPMRNQEPPKPIPQPDRIATRPIATPIPTPTPLVQPSPALTRPSVSPTPNPLASNRPTPNPVLTAKPTPIPSLTPEQQKVVREQVAKTALLDVMKKQGLEVDESYVPPNGMTNEEMLKMLSPEEQKKLDDAVDAYNKSVFDKFNPTVVATPNPNATPGPNASQDPNASPAPNNPGDPNGDPNGTNTGLFSSPNTDRAINNIDRNNDLDYANPSANPFGKPTLNNNGVDKNNNLPFSGNPLDEGEQDLDRNFEKEFSKPLSLPKASPPPMQLPDYRSTDQGFVFEYDRRSFSLILPNENSPQKQLLVNHYLKTRPRDSSLSFELIWKLEWESNSNLLIEAVIRRYEEIKKQG